MKKLLLLLPLIFCMCSKSENEVPATTFAISLTPSVNNVIVDEEFTIMVTANEPMKAIGVSVENDGSSGGQMQADFGTSRNFFFGFKTIGQKNISVKATSASGITIVKNITINVARGNAVKITKLQITSFENINATWDPEFAPTNPNSLADVYFGLYTLQRNNYYFEDQRLDSEWYKSNIKENQGDLIWDLSSSNLYITPNKEIKFGLADKDVDLGQSLIPNLPDYRIITLYNYMTTKPTTIIYSWPEVNLSFILTVEWPN